MEHKTEICTTSYEKMDSEKWDCHTNKIYQQSIYRGPKCKNPPLDLLVLLFGKCMYLTYNVNNVL